MVAGDPRQGAASGAAEPRGLRARAAEFERQAAEHRAVEETLRRELELTSAILDTAGALVVVLDREGWIVRFNRACEHTTGYRFEEIRGKPFWEWLLLPEEVESVRAVFEALRAGHFPNTHENYWVGKNGRRRLIAWSNTALLNRQGDVEYVIGTGIDVTERRQAEAALRESESRMRSVLNTVVDGIITIDERGVIQSFNPAAERIFGYRPDEVLGRNIGMLMPSPDREAHDLYIARYLRTGERRVIGHIREVTGLRRDGSTFPVELAISEADLGDRRLFTGIVRDITERKKAEEALRRAHDELERRVAERTAELRAINERLQWEVLERRQAEAALRTSEERIRLLCASAPVGIFETDAQDRCIYTNQRLREICGLREEELAAAGWQSCLHAQDRAILPEQFETVRREGAADSGELRLVRPDGELRWVTLRTAALRAPDGEWAGTVGTVEDITERRRAEDEIRRRELELAYLSRLYTVGEMAATLAHELNQPLTAISNYAQGAARRLQAEHWSRDDLRYALEQVSAEASRASQIIAAVRGFLRKHEPARVTACLNDLVREAIRLVEPELRRRGTELRLHLAETLPDVAADRVQIEQVLVNLMRNGLEAMEDTPAEQRILGVRTERGAPGAVEVTVEDRGCGLDADGLARAFEPFYTTKPQGMGMGLAICRSIVQAHGGRLWVESQPGQGALFRFVLPIGRRASV